MTKHKHKMVRKEGPRCCADGVAYIEYCSCGASREVCSCAQCEYQGTSKSRWSDPDPTKTPEEIAKVSEVCCGQRWYYAHTGFAQCGTCGAVLEKGD